MLGDRETEEYLAFYQTEKKNKTLNYSSNGTFSTANISMRPDAPFNNTLPVAWQERQARREEECSALLSAAAAHPGSHESRLRPRAPRLRRRRGGVVPAQPADHWDVQVHNYTDNAALFLPGLRN